MDRKRISIIGAGTVALTALAALAAAGYSVAQAETPQPKRLPPTPTEEAARIAAAEAKRARKNAKRLRATPPQQGDSRE